jgi:hypothetical protein
MGGRKEYGMEGRDMSRKEGKKRHTMKGRNTEGRIGRYRKPLT